MLKQLKMDLKLYKNVLWELLATSVFTFLLGFGVVTMVMLFADDPESWVTMGTFGALFGMVMCAILLFARYYQQFILALSMGRTRKAFLFSYAVRSLLYLVLGYGLVLVLYRVELAVGSRLFAPWPLEVDPTFLMDWKFIAVLLPCVVIVSMFVGSLYSTFGKKAMAPLWFVWMALCLFGPRLVHEENVAVLARIPGPVWVGIGIAAVAAMVGTVIALGKKQMVR